MSRWNQKAMLSIGEKLFKKIYGRKYHSHPNHDIHFLVREIDQWLPEGISSLINGRYDPRCLTRYYFSDEKVDQLHISDRVFQHVLLKIVKPTFKYVMSRNCYHLDGPGGVKNATQKIQAALQNSNLKYFIRTDIKSFYRSIPHYKLIQEIKKYYDDPKLIAMLINIIKNPIDTPYGYKNPDCGIALRGPLSQFFSELYLKPLDDSISTMRVTYLRYQDDILILCNTKRQLNRCKRKMMQVLQDRRLCLSKRKTRFGAIEESGFHFLGILYPPTRTEDNTNATPVKLTEARGEEATQKAGKDKQKAASVPADKSNNMGEVESLPAQQSQEILRTVHCLPHARTLRKAREHVKLMVADGASLCQIKNYLSRWGYWWVKTAGIWNYDALARQYINSCWDVRAANLGAFAFQQSSAISRLHSEIQRGTAIAAAV